MIYTLITPAFNEEAFIENTIKSVANQSVLPKLWVIISDSSTDRTDVIVKSFEEKYTFIKYHRISKNSNDYSFGSKALAFNKGYSILRSLNIEYDYIGNLDADITFEPGYYKILMDRVNSQSDLGLSGGHIYEYYNGKFRHQLISSDSVAGAVQFFKRECFEQLAGYIPLPYGGIDSAAEICVKANGWKVQTFNDLIVYHHRKVTTGKSHSLVNSFRHGITDNLLGYHPLFETLRIFYRVTQDPTLFRSLFVLFGYFYSFIFHRNRKLQDYQIAFLRKQQIHKIFSRNNTILKPHKSKK